MHEQQVTTWRTINDPTNQRRVAGLALRRRNLLYLFPGISDAMTVQYFLGDLARYGYLVDERDIPKLFTADPLSFGVVVDQAKRTSGAIRANAPTLHPDFRSTVPGLSEGELYLRALVHYFYRDLGAQWLAPGPVDALVERQPLKKRTLRTARIATDGDITDIADSLVGSSQPYSPTDFGDIRALGSFIEGGRDVPIRENLALLTAHRIGGADWTPYLKTPTDVLRVATELSGGDRSLGKNSKFRLTRANRRFVVKALEAVLNRREWAEHLEHIHAQEERWKRLLRTLHPQEYPWAQRVNDIRGIVHGDRHDWPKTRQWHIEEATREGDVDKLEELFRDNPGELARLLHSLWRAMPGRRNDLIEMFRRLAPRVSARVLVQMWNFFHAPPAQTLPYRVVLPKRSGSQAKYILNTLSADEDYSPIIEAIEHGLSGRLAGRRFHIDSDLADAAQRVTIPLGVRSASPGTRTVGRATRLALGDGEEMRFFLHWRNTKDEAVDLDLTAYYASEDFKQKGYVSYTRLRDDEVGVFHSGDITTAPEGAAEYIQLPFASMLASGYRYVVLTCFSYSRTPLDEIPDAQIGVLAGADLTTGEDFEASEVIVRIDLATPSLQATPAVIDLERRELIWLDWTTKVSDRRLVNIESAQPEIDLVLDNARHSTAMSVATYLRLTGAEIADDPAGAETLDPMHTEKVLSLLN